MKKSKLLLPLMIILTLFVVTLSACNKTYDNETIKVVAHPDAYAGGAYDGGCQ